MASTRNGHQTQEAALVLVASLVFGVRLLCLTAYQAHQPMSHWHWILHLRASRDYTCQRANLGVLIPSLLAGQFFTIFVSHIAFNQLHLGGELGGVRIDKHFVGITSGPFG